MKILLATWLFLACAVAIGFAHPLQNEDPATYEVKEDSSGHFIAVPKYRIPSLKDIYYYILGKLYAEEEPKPQRGITERSFTNAHGYQFADPDDAAADLFRQYPEDNADEEHAVKKRDDGSGDDDGRYLKDLAEPQPLTDEVVKEAYKAKSYLFDQMRQRYLPGSDDDFYLNQRKKRDAGTADPRFESDDFDQAGFAIPKTYGMDLSHNGGYVWNSMHEQPGMYYEVGDSSHGDESLAPYQLAQNPPNLPEHNGSDGEDYEFTPPPEEPITESPEDERDYDDIFVPFTRPSALPLEATEESIGLRSIPIGTVENAAAEGANNDETSSTVIPIEPILGLEVVDNREDKTVSENPAAIENPDQNPNGPIESSSEAHQDVNNENKPIPENSAPIDTTTNAAVSGSNDASEKPIEEVSKTTESSVQPFTNPSVEESGNDSQKPIEPLVSTDKPAEESSSSDAEEASTANPGSDQKEIPDAPLLPPINYESLPQDIREAISSTEKSTVATLGPDDKVTEDKTNDMLTSTPTLEKKPKTYGMDLKSGSGHVWNDLVDPPISFDVGSPNGRPAENNEPEETKTEQPQPEEPRTEQPQPEEPKTEQPEPEEPKTEQPQPEVPRTEQPQPEEPKTEQPQPEEPRTEQPQPEEPRTEQPQTEEPRTEQPQPEEPRTEQPQTEEPRTEQPQTEEPRTEQPQTEEPRTEQPQTEEPKTEQPQTEEPRTEQPQTETPKTEQPQTEEPRTEQPQTEEPRTEQPQTEEPKTEQPQTEEPKPEDKPDLVTELLSSRKFWNWFTDWSALYTKEVEKATKSIVRKELCNYAALNGEVCSESDDSLAPQPILKRRDDDNSRRGDKTNKVDATTIYGNSVGNEKVTNVFIFNANDAKQVLEELKPEEDSKVTLTIDTENKEEANDKVEVKESKEIEDEVKDINETEDNAEIQEIEQPKEGEIKDSKAESTTTIEPKIESNEPEDRTQIAETTTEARVVDKMQGAEKVALTEEEILDRSLEALEE